MASPTKRNRDDDMKRKKVARMRFRLLVRSVMFNRIWLTDTGDQKFSLNVKKNIAMLVRPKRKVGMLTMAEKSLIRTHHYMRSVEDRKKLVTLLAGLTCFSRLPPKTRARLVPVVKFLLLGPGRTVMREGDPPRTIYFILSGEVEITKKTYDRLRNEYVEVVDSIAGPGDCLGEVELIEECDRLNTYTTTTEVELLVLFHEDFDDVLRPVMGRQWLDKKAALLALEYFDFFNYEQVITACKLGVIRQFNPLETIYYEDKGQVSYVHFVISGECVILQCLKMKVTQKKGGKLFDLIELSKDDNDSMFQTLSNAEMLKMMKEGDERNKPSTKLDIDRLLEMDDELHHEDSNTKKEVQKMDLRSIEISCGLRRPSSVHLTSERSSYYDMRGEEGEIHCEESSGVYEHSESIATIEVETKQIYNRKHSHKVRYDISKEPIDPDAASRKTGVSEESSDSEEELFNKEVYEKTDNNTNVESRFIDVGTITFGGIFGLGEKMEHRVIMARTTVQCLMLPRYWLYEKEQNPGDIWQRRRFYLDSTIPSRKSLFKDFVTTQKWQKFKNDLIERNVKSMIGNPTKVQDIPIYCRIVEAGND